MEGGSLIQEALQYMEEHQEADESLELWIDAFASESDASTEVLLPQLALLASRLNAAFQKHKYPWHSGGEGPVFGVNVSERVPHLRAICRYGPSIEDAWAAVALAIHVSSSFPDLIFRCWDRDDGHLLLIEAAEILPSWVDRVGPSACRYRCWLVGGQVTLIRPRDALDRVGLKDALDRIRNKASALQRPRKVQTLIETRISKLLKAIQSGDWSEHTHLAPLILPKAVALLLRSQPTLANYAVHAFPRYIPTPRSTPAVHWRDLVWTKHRFSRTTYAMLRSVITPKWPSESFLPTAYQSAETDMMMRQKQASNGGHLDHALSLGARLTAGFDSILSVGPGSEKEKTASPMDRICKLWTAIDVASGGNGDWLRQCWIAGPNNSKVDLSSLISCPILCSDLRRPTIPFPLSSPGSSLTSLIRTEFNRRNNDAPVQFQVPGTHDVDGESWLVPNEDYLAEKTQNTEHAGSADFIKVNESPHEEGTEQLDEVLDSFQTFMSAKADVEGVASDRFQSDDLSQCSIDVDPTVFMNLLHTALKSSPDELREILVATNEAGDRSFDDEDDSVDEATQDLMSRMDDELKSAMEVFDDDCDDVANEVRVLSNLVGSMDLSGAAPGPVRNILAEMGVLPPGSTSE